MRMSSDNAMTVIAPDMMESIAKVVAVDGSVVWLEPDQAGSCGSCASSGACSAKGVGTEASRPEVRCFPLSGHAGLKVGDRIVVGVGEDALVQASMTVYALPLATMFASGFVAQWAYGSDAATVVACFAGLGAGFAFAAMRARRISADGRLTPRFLRRAPLGAASNIV